MPYSDRLIGVSSAAFRVDSTRFHAAQVSNMLMWRRPGGTVLTAAAHGRRTDAFEAVIDTCRERLTDEQVYKE